MGGGSALFFLALLIAPSAESAAGIAVRPRPLSGPALLAAAAAVYRLDPGIDAVADLGEGSYAQVRSGFLPDPAPALLGAVLPAAAGDPVAVKIPYRAPKGMPAWEAEASRRVQAAGGAELFVPGAHDPGLGVLVMPRLSGYMPIDEWAEDRRISPRTIRRIAAQLKRALAALEAAGLVHSDLKPDNVLIGPYARVRILDFGLAAEEGRTPPYARFYGRRGGHPDYVSPNQADDGPAAFADDRYSVAQILLRLRP